jgi:serine/threonine protein phosphatase PrpC
VTSTISVEAAGRTHTGLVRRRNEDALYVGRSLFAVADGLGGHPAGDRASAAVIEALPRYDRPVGPTELLATLGQAVRAANEALRQEIEVEPQLAGMGTTLVALLCSGSSAVLANVGDSRAYLLRNGDPDSGTTAQITEDHTYDRLLADATDVPNLGERLSRWLDGRDDGRSPDLTTWDLRPGDRFMLCSDGLSSFVSPDLIDTTLRSSTDPAEAADRLVALAIDHGGRDNVTVVVIDVRGQRRCTGGR